MKELTNKLLLKLVNDYMDSYTKERRNGQRLYNDVIIGISRGDDPLYQFLKEDIGDFYWTPVEAFNQEYNNYECSNHELSIISWILPQTEETRLSQRKEVDYPSFNWVQNRLDGEELNENIRAFLVSELKNMGYMAMAPVINCEWKNVHSDKYGYASSWSERHTAYISGLGTFGLCDGLITKVGKAHRCGSIIVKCNLEITPRDYKTHTEYCLYYKNGSCKVCIKRCPTGAITEEGHNKLLCRAYQRDKIRPHNIKEYKLALSSCGLCQTKVPCESSIPK